MKKRPLICVVAANCVKKFVIDIINGVIKQAQVCGCDVAVLAPLTHFLGRPISVHHCNEREIYRLILSDDFDGYIYCKSTSSMDAGTMRYIESLLTKTNKFVMVADGNSNDCFDYTQSDDFDDFKCIVEHLINVHGYKKIYCLTGPKALFQSEERLKGYFAAMDNHGLYYDDTYYSYGDFWKTMPKAYAMKIASGELAMPDAVVCGNDTMAYTLMESLESHGIHVPSDVAVTGYDGCDPGPPFCITLTTFKKDNFQLGADCMRRLYRNISGRLCSRAMSEENGFIFGSSCGCIELPMFSGKKRREKKIAEIYRDQMDYSSMLFEVTQSQSIEELFQRCSYYAYMIYKMKYLNIFLTQECIEAISDGRKRKLRINGENIMQPVFSKTGDYKISFEGKPFRTHSILQYFGEDNGKPRAFYLSPIHVEDRFFGVSALSFGKLLFQYDVTYMFFIHNIETALDRLLHGAYQKQNSISNLFQCSELCTEESSELTFLCCEITDIKLLYGKYGGKRTISTIKDAVSQITEKLEGEAVCNMLTDNKIGFIFNGQSKAEKIFYMLKRISITASIPFSFSLGECKLRGSDINEDDNFYEMIGEAINHTIYIYKQQCGGSQQLYEKLYELRKEMKHTPESKWEIEEMSAALHISRSTLQKNYKAFFGKSIIEELILFRVEKSKKLLKDTPLSLSVIAEKCGYSSDTYFIKQFRKLEGITPNDYRNENN